MKIKKYSLFFIIIICSLILTGCENKDDSKELKAKSSSQISYMESTLSKLTNGVILMEYNAKNDENLKSKMSDNKSNQSNKDENKNDNGNNSKENEKNGESEDENSTKSNEIKEFKSESESQSTKDNDTSGDLENSNSEMNPTLDWNKINSELEDIYSTWSVLAIDLNKMNVDNDEILGFGQVINDINLSIQAKDEATLLISLANLYSYIPKYISSYSEDSFEVAKKNIKYYIISTGVLIKNDRWEEATKQIEIAESEYIKLMNNVNYVNKNSYNMNKVYILLEEVKNSIQYNNKDIFFLKYKTLTEEI